MLNIKKIHPLFNQVVTTAHRYTEDQTVGGVIMDTKRYAGALKEYQTVVAIGPMVRNIEVGDTVMINPKRYARMKHQEGSLKDGVITDNPVVQYNIPIIELDHEKYLFIQDNDIDFIIADYDEEEDTKSVVIIPEKPEIMA